MSPSRVQLADLHLCPTTMPLLQNTQLTPCPPGTPILPTFTTISSLHHAHTSALQPPTPNLNRALSLSQHIAIAESHPSLSFPATSINLPPSILSYARTKEAATEPAPSEPFETWLTRAWSTPQPSRETSANTVGKQSRKSSRSGSSQKSKRPTPLGEDPRGPST